MTRSRSSKSARRTISASGRCRGGAQRPLRARSGQFSIEYAVLILVIVGALLGISIYMKRALSSGMRDSADSIGYGRQYEP